MTTPFVSVDDDADDADDDVGLVRSFLGGPRSASAPESTSAEPTVRAFMLTNGRTTSNVDLAFESMVSLSDLGRVAQDSLAFERAAIAELCADGAQSIAELAAKLHVPLGTIRVLAADMVGEEVLDAHLPQENLSGDVAMLRRLIHGVRAL